MPYVVAGSRPSGRYVRSPTGGPLGYATLGTEWPRDALFEPYPRRRRTVLWTAPAAPAPPIIPIIRTRIVRARKRAAWQVPAVRRARRDVAGAMAGRAGAGPSGLTTWDIGACCCGGVTTLCPSIDGICGAGTALPSTLHVSDTVLGGPFTATYQAAGDFFGYWVATGTGHGGIGVLWGLTCTSGGFGIVLGEIMSGANCGLDLGPYSFGGQNYCARFHPFLSPTGSTCPPTFSWTSPVLNNAFSDAWNSTDPQTTWSQ